MPKGIHWRELLDITARAERDLEDVVSEVSEVKSQHGQEHTSRENPLCSPPLVSKRGRWLDLLDIPTAR